MPKMKFQTMKLRKATLATIERANQIIADYQAQGLDLTLRQLYYQFVSRAWIANNDKEYKKLGNAIADGRMAGLIDWEAIVDRTRYVRDLAHWGSPEDIVEACSRQFRLNKWARQDHYVEVWIEKDALIGVIEGVCQENDVPFMACRGYASASEIWRAGNVRIRQRLLEKKKVLVFYLGDHDPSGLDMTRDLQARIDTFTRMPGKAKIKRLALNMDQIELYAPPPNPTKTTDSRAEWYLSEYGTECWELDALDPVVIRDLIQHEIDEVRDQALWDEAVAEENQAKAHLAAIAENWDDVVANLS